MLNRTKTNRTNGTREAGDATKREGGFTILETVIALFVMLVVGLGAVSFFLYSTNFNAGASDRARALAVAQQKMEALRAVDYTTLATVAAGASYNGTVVSGSTAAADPRSFTVVTTVVDDPNFGTSRQKLITVTVTPAAAGRWTGGSVTLRSARSQNLLGSN